LPDEWTRTRQRLWRWTPEFRERTRTVRAAYLDSWRPLPASVGRMCVVTTGRSGSELLCDLLDRHPRVLAEGEVLRHAPQFTRAFLRGRVHAARRAGADAYVFKLAALQLVFPRAIQQPTLLFADLAADGFHFIHLSRRDRIRQALSFVRAQETGSFHPRTDSAALGGTQMVDPVELIGTLHWLEQQEAHLTAAMTGLDVRHLTYEDNLEDPVRRRATLATLFADLGVETVCEESDLRPATPRPLGDAIANLDEVLDALRRTRFGSAINV
jgi:LPS sulfotransferase NodH